MSTKACSKCGEEKSLDLFYQHKSGRQAGRLMASCKECQRRSKAIRYAARKGGQLPTALALEQVCGDCDTLKPIAEYGVDHARPNGRKAYCNECVRNRWFVSKYGITAADYADMLARQGGVCAICSLPERTLNRLGELKPLSVDHDHKTGRVRGLLCDDCNVALGRMCDDPDRLVSAASYLLTRGVATTSSLSVQGA